MVILNALLLVLTGLVSAGVAALVGGADAALGAVVGALLAIVFLTTTRAVLQPMTRLTPQLSVLVALMFFATKMLALLAVLVVLLDPGVLGDRVDEKALGCAVMAVALAWTLTRIREHRRSRQPLYDLGDNLGHAPDSLRGQ